jgi:hypothetical protein
LPFRGRWRHKIEASFKKGLLTVTLPKKPEAQKTAKKIEVKATMDCHVGHCQPALRNQVPPHQPGNPGRLVKFGEDSFRVLAQKRAVFS